MTAYWFFFITFSYFSINPIRFDYKLKILSKIFILFLLTIFIGLRHQVGGDWDIYLYDFNRNITSFNLIELSYVRDFGYELISFVTYKLSLGIYGLNLILAFFFVYALNKFANEFKENYWLIFAIAFPYIITVVAMGFTRQAAAFAFVLISISELKNKKILTYVLFSILAILFHKSSVVLISLVLLTHYRLTYKNIFIFIFFFIISFLIISPELNRIISGYLSEDTRYVSKGVYYRIIINIFAGLIFIIFYKKLKVNKNIDKLIILIFVANLFFLFYANNYSTLVDRINIYFTIIQLIVFSRIYLIYPRLKIIFNIFVLFIYSYLYIGWLYLSDHSYAWIPYNNIIFEILK